MKVEFPILIVFNNAARAGKTCTIPAGETKDCVIPYTASGIIGTVYIQAYRPVENSHTQIGKTSKPLTITQGSGNPTSSNILLSSSIEVENSELISGIDHNVYGTSFKGVVTLTNPEANTDFYGQFQCDLYDQNNNRKAIFIDIITVPANGSFSFTLEFNGLESGKNYYVYSYYAYAKWNNFANYTVKPGIVTYTADGSLSVEKVTSSNYSVPSGVLAVDLTTTTDITSIPGGVSLTTEESAEAANLLSDILTYAGTEITKYIMGDNSMDDYDTFTSTMEELGINRVVEIYQAAYDRYLSK